MNKFSSKNNPRSKDSYRLHAQINSRFLRNQRIFIFEEIWKLPIVEAGFRCARG